MQNNSRRKFDFRDDNEKIVITIELRLRNSLFGIFLVWFIEKIISFFLSTFEENAKI